MRHNIITLYAHTRISFNNNNNVWQMLRAHARICIAATRVCHVFYYFVDRPKAKWDERFFQCTSNIYWIGIVGGLEQLLYPVAVIYLVKYF